MARVTISICGVLTWLFPLCLIACALSRLIIPSFFYLFSAYYFILFAPITLTFGDKATHTYHYTYSYVYFLLHVILTACILISHLVGALLVYTDVFSYSDLSDLFGISSLTDSAVEAVHLLLPDVLMFVISIITLFVLQKKAGGHGEQVTKDKETQRAAWNLIAFIALLFSGILYISLIALPYFLLFIALLLHLTFRSYLQRRHAHVPVMPGAPAAASLLPRYSRLILTAVSYYLPTHLTLLFLYQFTSLPIMHFTFSRLTINLLGLWTPTPIMLFHPTPTAYISCAVHLLLFACCGERRERQKRKKQIRGRIEAEAERDRVLDQELGEEEEGEESEANDEESLVDNGATAPAIAPRSSSLNRDLNQPLIEVAPSTAISEKLRRRREQLEKADYYKPYFPAEDTVVYTPIKRRGVKHPSSTTPSTASAPAPVTLSSSLFSCFSQARRTAMRHDFLRVFRYSGRFLCSLLLFVTIFTLPSLLSILLLILLIVSLLTSTHEFTHLAPYYMFFLLLASIVLYIFSIPLLFSSWINNGTDQESNKYIELIGLVNQHIPFRFVLDMVAPSLMFAAYLICYRLSLSSLNEESIIIAVASGDEVMVDAALQQQPPVLITQTRDEKQRNLLMLACRYGQVDLILRLCRHLDINAQDSRGKTALHYAYYYGYDRIVKLLLLHPDIDTERVDQNGMRPLEQERSRWVRFKVWSRQLLVYCEIQFINHAEKISLLLLYIVATSALDVFHLLFFLLFLLFFTFPRIAEKYWSVLVVYSAIVLLTLFSFSVLYPAFEPLPPRSQDWADLMGLFTAQSYILDLALYYVLFFVVVVQWNVFVRKVEAQQIQEEHERRKRQRQHQGLPYTPGITPATALPTTVDIDYEREYSLSFYRTAVIILATSVLYIVCMLPPASLFRLGYLSIFLLAVFSLCFVQNRHMLLVLYACSCTYALCVLALEYAYLSGGFDSLSAAWRDVSSFTVELDAAAIGFVKASGTMLTWTLLPVTSVFVTQVIQLRVHIQSWRASDEAADDGSDPTVPVSPAAPAAPSPRPGLEPGAAQPVASDGTVSISIHPSSPSPPPGISATPAGTTSGVAVQTRPQIVRAISDPPTSSATSSRRGSSISMGDQGNRRWALAVQEALAQYEAVSNSAFYQFVLGIYNVLFSLFHSHCHRLLAITLILVVTLVDLPISLFSLVYVTFLICFAPIHQGFFLYIPIMFYTAVLMVAKYIYQLPSVLDWSQTHHHDWFTWVGLDDWDGAVFSALWGDSLIFFFACLQQMVVKQRRKSMLEEAEEQEELGPTAADEDKPVRDVSEARLGRSGETSASDSSMLHQKLLGTPTSSSRSVYTFGQGSPSRTAAASPEPESAIAANGEPSVSTTSSTSRLSQKEKQRQLLHTGAAETIVSKTEEKREVSAPPTTTLTSKSGTTTILPVKTTTPYTTTTTAGSTLPVPSAPTLAAVHSSPPTAAPAAVNNVDIWSLSDYGLYLRALCLSLFRRASHFSSHFLTEHAMRVALLLTLLTACYRNNLLSLIYLAFAGIYIIYGRHGIDRVWKAFTVFVACTIVWQLLLLLTYGPFSFIDLPLDNNPPLQRWLLWGNFSPSSVTMDLFTFFFLCLQLPYITPSAQAVDRRQVYQQAGKHVDHESTSMLIIYTEEDYQLWKKQEEQLEARERLQQQQLDAAASKHPAGSMSGVVDFTPSSMSRYRVMERKAALVWPSLLFYLSLSMDHLFFLFIFAAATAFPDVLSLPYLFFSFYLLVSNKLYIGDKPGFIRLYQYLHIYNFLVLLLILLYQLPSISCAALDTGLHWQNVVGLRKFVCDCGVNTCVDALSTSGALSQILIFFLIDLQLLVVRSPAYTRIEEYYAEARSLSSLRHIVSHQHVQQQNKIRILTILALRDHISQSFNDVFLLANKLNPAYFEDETVWSTPKPLGWDEAVAKDMRQQEEDEKERKEGETQRQRQIQKDQAQEEAEEAKHASPQTEQQRREAQAEASLHAEKEKLKPKAKPPTSVSPAEEESFTQSLKHRFRNYLIAHIDMTLFTRYIDTQSQASSYVDEQEKQHAQAAGLGLAPTPASSTIQPVFKIDPHTLSTFTLIYRYLVTQSQYIVFFAFFMSLLIHPDFLSCVVPVSIICYALFEHPRAGKSFFLFTFYWSTVQIVIEFIFQWDIFCVEQVDRSYGLAPSPLCAPVYDDPSFHYQNDYLWGMVKATSSFFVLVLPELVCMLCIVWHRELCLERGVWNDQQDVDVVHPEVLKLLEKYEAQHTQPLGGNENLDETTKTVSSTGSSTPPPVIPAPNLHSANRIQGWFVYIKLKLLHLSDYLPVRLTSYYRSVVPQQRLHGININKPGSDFFLVLFFVELICAALILFNWDNMAATTTTSVSSFTTSLFSAQMVLTLFIQILIIVVDRMIYTFRSIFAKIILQYMTCVFWLVQILFVWPVWSEQGLIYSASLSIFLLLKFVYFFFSGLQIFHGFPPVETSGLHDLIKHPGIYTMKIYQLYRAIPFVFELRTILDWMCTMTALDIDETFKLEDIYTRLYLVQCQLIFRREHRRGDSRPWDDKLFNGVVLFILLLVIIFLPLLLFSSANPVTVSNTVTSTSTQLSLVGPNGEWDLFTISSLNNSGNISTQQYGLMMQQRLIDSNDHQSDIQILQFSNFSDSLWSITSPALSTLINTLYNPDDSLLFYAVMTYSFSRPLPSTSPTISLSIRTLMNTTLRQEMGDFISTSQPRDVIILPQLLPTYLRLPASTAPVELQPDQRSDIELFIVNDQNSSATRYFQAYIAPNTSDAAIPTGYCNYSNAENNEENLPVCNIAFVTISNRVFGGIFSEFSISIISLYSIILFTFGQFIRLLFSNLVQKIPYEDIQNADRLLALVEAIYVARWKKELRIEEILYRRLIKIMRTGPLLIELTRRDIEAETHDEQWIQRQQREQEEEREAQQKEKERQQKQQQELATAEQRTKTPARPGASPQQPQQQQRQPQQAGPADEKSDTSDEDDDTDASSLVFHHADDSAESAEHWDDDHHTRGPAHPSPDVRRRL